MNINTLNTFKSAVGQSLVDAINSMRNANHAAYTVADFKQAMGPTVLKKVNVANSFVGDIFLHMGLSPFAINRPKPGASDAAVMKHGLLLRIETLSAGCRPGDYTLQLSIVPAVAPMQRGRTTRHEMRAGKFEAPLHSVLDAYMKMLDMPPPAFFDHLLNGSDSASRRIRQHAHSETLKLEDAKLAAQEAKGAKRAAQEAKLTTTEAAPQQVGNLIDALCTNRTVQNLACYVPEDVRPEKATVILTHSYADMNQSQEDWTAAGCPLVFEPVTHFWDNEVDATMVVFECATHSATLSVTYSGDYVDADGNIKVTDVIEFGVSRDGIDEGSYHCFELSRSGRFVAAYAARMYVPASAEQEQAEAPEDGWEWLTPVQGRPQRPLNFEAL